MAENSNRLSKTQSLWHESCSQEAEPLRCCRLSRDKPEEGEGARCCSLEASGTPMDSAGIVMFSLPESSDDEDEEFETTNEDSRREFDEDERVLGFDGLTQNPEVIEINEIRDSDRGLGLGVDNECEDSRSRPDLPENVDEITEHRVVNEILVLDRELGLGVDNACKDLSNKPDSPEDLDEITEITEVNEVRVLNRELDLDVDDACEEPWNGPDSTENADEITEANEIRVLDMGLGLHVNCSCEDLRKKTGISNEKEGVLGFSLLEKGAGVDPNKEVNGSRALDRELGLNVNGACEDLGDKPGILHEKEQSLGFSSQDNVVEMTQNGESGLDVDNQCEDSQKRRRISGEKKRVLGFSSLKKVVESTQNRESGLDVDDQCENSRKKQRILGEKEQFLGISLPENVVEIAQNRTSSLNVDSQRDCLRKTTRPQSTQNSTETGFGLVGEDKIDLTRIVKTMEKLGLPLLRSSKTSEHRRVLKCRRDDLADTTPVMEENRGKYISTDKNQAGGCNDEFHRGNLISQRLELTCDPVPPPLGTTTIEENLKRIVKTMEKLGVPLLNSSKILDTSKGLRRQRDGLVNERNRREENSGRGTKELMHEGSHMDNRSAVLNGCVKEPASKAVRANEYGVDGASRREKSVGERVCSEKENCKSNTSRSAGTGDCRRRRILPASTLQSTAKLVPQMEQDERRRNTSENVTVIGGHDSASNTNEDSKRMKVWAVLRMLAENENCNPDQNAQNLTLFEVLQRCGLTLT